MQQQSSSSRCHQRREIDNGRWGHQSEFARLFGVCCQRRAAADESLEGRQRRSGIATHHSRSTKPQRVRPVRRPGCVTGPAVPGTDDEPSGKGRLGVWIGPGVDDVCFEFLIVFVMGEQCIHAVLNSLE